MNIRKGKVYLGILMMLTLLLAACAPAAPMPTAEAEATEDGALLPVESMTRETGATVSVQAVGDITVHSYLAPVQAFANNTHIIETANSLVLIDTQFLLPMAMDFRAYADSLGKPIERLIITHEHPDHFLGSEAFADVDVYALAEVAASIEANGQAEVDEKQAEMGDMIAGTFVVPMTLEPGTVEIDGVTFAFDLVTNAEAEVQVVTKLPDHGIISVGDIVYSGVHLIMAGAPPTWIEALESLKAESDAYPIVLPGHGAATDPSVYDVNIAWLSKAGELMETATTADEFKTGLMEAFPELGLDGAIDFVTPMLFPADDAGAMGSDTPSEELSNAEKVVALLNSLTTGDITVAEAYVGEEYIQHNIGMPSGRDAFIGLVGQLAGMNLPIDVVRVIEDGDYVAAHTDAGMSALVDVYRFEDGLIVEHWDNVQDVTGPNPSGHTMFDGATEITDLDKTEENRAMIIQMLDEVLIQGNSDNIANYISTETYIQHNPGVADGLDGFGAAMAEFAAQGIFMEYHTVHHVMAQGNFVLSISEGTFGGEPTSFYDIFRIEDGLVVEHWDVIEAILPEDQWQNDNGKFNFPGGPVIGNAESGAADAGSSDEAEESDAGEMASGFELVEVAEDLYSFGDGGAYGAFLVTDEGVIVMDTLNTNAAGPMMDAIRSVTDQPIAYLIYSHNHWDHISGGQIFKDAGATVLAHEDITDWLVNHPAPNPAVVIPDESWSGDRFDVQLGGKTVELHHFGASHGEGMTVFRFPETQAIFTVDLVVPKRVGFVYMPDFSPRGWIATLEKMETLEFETVLFAHNAPFGPRSAVTEQKQFLLDLQEHIMTRMQAGENPMQVIGSIDLPQYKDWAGYDAWISMNAWRIVLESMMGQ